MSPSHANDSHEVKNVIRRHAPGVVCAALFAAAWAPHDAQAKPSGPMLFCAAQPDAPACQGALPTCDMCHTTTYPVSWNAYGASLFPGLGGDFEANLGAAIQAVADADADGDGLSNAAEIAQGTWPGDPLSRLVEDPTQDADPNPRWDIGEWDARFAYKRTSLTFCGRSPTFAEYEAFDALPSDDDRIAAVHAALDECVQSPYWRAFVLPRLADKRIRPLAAVGQDSTVGIRLADYDWDYRLWVWALTDGRDARDLLTADYHVEPDGTGGLRKVEGAFGSSQFGGPQPLEPERRAGMITTQWFFVINTMFSSLPRTTAAQAYRAYLGADISRYEGIRPVANEPADVDRKGVQEAECASCHSTLDPLSYAFAPYNGISGGGSGRFNPNRAGQLIPDWADNQAVIADVEVDDLVAWAAVAASSDAFMRTLGLTFFRLALGRDPSPDENPEFIAMWRALPEDGYSLDAMLHRLVDTKAFGAPR
jgi:hypothetical protein